MQYISLSWGWIELGWLVMSLDAASGPMMKCLPAEAVESQTKQNEQRWIRVTVQHPAPWLCTFIWWLSSCGPELLHLSFFKLFSGEPNEKSAFYPETKHKTFSCARGHSFMRASYYFYHPESHHRQSISSLSFIFYRSGVVKVLPYSCWSTVTPWL